MSDTFITNALDQMTSRTNFIGHMASDIYCTDTDGEPRVAHQITAYYAKLQNARSSAAVTNSSYSGAKPASSFSTELMTKVCWNADDKSFLRRWQRTTKRTARPQPNTAKKLACMSQQTTSQDCDDDCRH